MQQDRGVAKSSPNISREENCDGLRGHGNPLHLPAPTTKELDRDLMFSVRRTKNPVNWTIPLGRQKGSALETETMVEQEIFGTVLMIRTVFCLHLEIAHSSRG